MPKINVIPVQDIANKFTLGDKVIKSFDGILEIETHEDKGYAPHNLANRTETSKGWKVVIAPTEKGNYFFSFLYDGRFKTFRIVTEEELEECGHTLYFATLEPSFDNSYEPPVFLKKRT